MAEVVALYADGGVLGRNPSPHGGSWAWCHVDSHGYRVRGEAGLMVPGLTSSQTGQLHHLHVEPWPELVVSNNQMEFVALVLGLEALPKGWAGRVCSDSKVSLGRLFRGWKLSNLPEEWIARGSAVLGRLGQVETVLLDGHPTKAQLQAGRGKRGQPVSVHNVFCDRECGRVAREWMVLYREK